MRVAFLWASFLAFALVVHSPRAGAAESAPGRVGLWVHSPGGAAAGRVADIAQRLGEALRELGRPVVAGEEALRQAPVALPVAQCLHDTPCLVEIGEAAKLGDLVVGTVGERAGAWSLTLDRVNVRLAKVERHVFHDTGGDHPELLAAISDMTRRLFNNESAPAAGPSASRPAPAEPPPTTTSPTPSRSSLRLAAYGSLGVGVLLSAVGAVYGFGVRNAAAEVTGRCCLEVPSGRPIYDMTRVDALEKRRDVNDMGEMSNTMYGAGLVAVGAGAVLWILSEGEAPAVAWRPGGVEIGVAF